MPDASKAIDAPIPTTRDEMARTVYKVMAGTEPPQCMLPNGNSMRLAGYVLSLLAAHESAIRADERQQCLSAVENEALTDPSDSEGDASYDSAIQHAAEAIRSMADPLAQTQGTPE